MKKEKKKEEKIEETSQVVALDWYPRTNVDCYVVVREHDSKFDSLVDCCGLVGGVSNNARSTVCCWGGGIGESKEVAMKNCPSVET